VTLLLALPLHDREEGWSKISQTKRQTKVIGNCRRDASTAVQTMVYSGLFLVRIGWRSRGSHAPRLAPGGGSP
jgi:hypothetical protein